jgi:hypothetical protein
MVGSCLGTNPTGTRTGISAVHAEKGIEEGAADRLPASRRIELLSA